MIAARNAGDARNPDGVGDGMGKPRKRPIGAIQGQIGQGC